MSIESKIIIQETPLAVPEYHNWLKSDGGSVGAVSEFTGYVRVDKGVEHQSGVDAIVLEHYPGMAESSIEAIVAGAADRWSLARVVVVHRVGRLGVGEDIVYVGVASRHRADGFEAVAYIMDFLKNDVPIWKKACSGADEQWVEQKNTDIEAKNNW